MSFLKILCPTDFSPGSEEAVRVAARFAKAAGAQLVISHAWFVPPLAYAGDSWPLNSEVIDQMLKDDQLALSSAVESALRLGVSKVDSLLVNGRPGDRIVSILREDPAYDLVVVGTRGRTGLKRVLLGSVAEQVVRHAPCSVLVAHACPADAPIQSVLCPVDFSDSSLRAVNLAAELVAPGGTGITLLHSIELPTRYGEDAALMNIVEQIDEQTDLLLENWAAQLRARTGAAVTKRTSRGGAGAQILTALEQGTFDLVVMGSHGRTGIRRAVLGSVAEKVARHATCPVLVARTAGQPEDVS